jgi:DNA-directed RNA polymerase subunit RPC12/RpoP
MTEAQYPQWLQLTLIERPRCPRCSSRMMLARICPGPVGFEHRSFECPKCDTVQTEVIASDPMQSRAAGWLSGDLHHPT